MSYNETKDRNETMKLVCVLSLLLLILLVLSLYLMNNLEYPTANTEPKTQYMELPALENMSLAGAKQVLDALDISYEVIPTQSRVANRIEKIEYLGKEEDGKKLYEIGTTVKLHSNEVGADKVIYLTFDDGPMVRYNLDMTVYYTTEELLDVLDEYGVKATFFLAGYQMVKSDRSHFVNELYEKGHLIACHSYSHDFGKIYDSTNDFIADVKEFELALENILGKEKYNSIGKYIRFPGGTNSNGVISGDESLEYINAIRGEGYKVYDWTFLTNDADDHYRLAGESDKDYFMRSMKNGLEGAKGKNKPLILLMHDKMEMTDVLPDILDYLIGEGYYFDTLENCPEYTTAE